MTTFSHLTGDLFGEALTSSQADSPASHIPLPESEKARAITDISGRRCLEQLERFGHVTSWAKTFSALLIGQGEWFSRMCTLTWKLRATRSLRFYFQLVPSELKPVETEFGLLDSYPTPAAFDAVHLKSFRNDSNLLSGGRHSVSLTHYIAMIHGNTGDMNPLLPESLNGYPLGWTDLEASETA